MRVNAEFGMKLPGPERSFGACGRQSLSPYGAAPFTQGSLFSAETPNRQPNSKRRLSAQARGSLQLPRNTQPVPAKEQGRCPRGHSLLGALWFFLAARKNNNKLRATEIVPPTAIYNLVMMQPSPHRSSYSPYALKAHPLRPWGNSKHPSVTAKHTAASPLSHLR